MPHACAESRRVALKLYEPILGTWDYATKIYANLDQGIIYFENDGEDPCSLFEILDGVDQKCLDRIRYLAVEEEMFMEHLASNIMHTPYFSSLSMLIVVHDELCGHFEGDVYNLPDHRASCGCHQEACKSTTRLMKRMRAQICEIEDMSIDLYDAKKPRFLGFVSGLLVDDERIPGLQQQALEIDQIILNVGELEEKLAKEELAEKELIKEQRAKGIVSDGEYIDQDHDTKIKKHYVLRLKSED